MLNFIQLFLFCTSALAFDWQGHRGARGLYPENTIGAMQEALKYPVTTLEMDVVISKDDQVVVSHEPWMSEEICLTPEGKPIKGEEINLYQLSYEEIQKYDCGSKPHPRFKEQQKIAVGKPLLRDLIAAMEPKLKELKRAGLSYNIEIKSTPEDEKRGYQPKIEKFADLVLKEVLAQLPLDRFTIQSFDWRVLKYIHQKNPRVHLVALREESFEAPSMIKELGFVPAVFSPYYKVLSPEQVDYFHQHKILVIPWTVNTVEEMKAIRAMKVDGIITDYPNLIQEAEGPLCSKDQNYFQGRCVKIPVHAIPSQDVPGWDCKPGYVQKRMHCEKIKLPKHSHLTVDGKNWECDPGFERYRDSCKK